jgi:hypothetical protein
MQYQTSSRSRCSRMPRSRANIDHLALAPGGVFTIDAKHYQGRLQVRARGEELWIAGRNRSKLLEQARRQTGVVQQVLSVGGLEDVPVTPVLCFVGTQMSRLFPPSRAGGVLLTTARKLRTLLTEGDGAIDAEVRSSITDALEAALPPADASSQGSKRAAKDATAEVGAAPSALPLADGRSLRVSAGLPTLRGSDDGPAAAQRRCPLPRLLGVPSLPEHPPVVGGVT